MEVTHNKDQNTTAIGFNSYSAAWGIAIDIVMPTFFQALDKKTTAQPPKGYVISLLISFFIVLTV